MCRKKKLKVSYQVIVLQRNRSSSSRSEVSGFVWAVVQGRHIITADFVSVGGNAVRRNRPAVRPCRHITTVYICRRVSEVRIDTTGVECPGGRMQTRVVYGGLGHRPE